MSKIARFYFVSAAEQADLCLTQKKIQGSYLMIFDDNSKIILSNLHKNLCCGCSLESPRRGDSNEHTQHRFYEEISKIIT